MDALSLPDRQDVETRAGGISVIVNAHSGPRHEEALATRLALLFEQHGVAARVVLADRGENLVAVVRRQLALFPSALVAAGGDGTVGTLAGLALEAGIPLGVLPIGTLNHFAKDLGLPLGLEDAVRVIAAGHTRQVDVGEVNGRVFVNNSSLGLYPRLVRHRERAQRRLGIGKWSAFALAALRVLRRHIFLTVSLVADRRRVRRRTPFVFIGNNEYQMESLNMVGRACFDGGRLGVVMARRPGRWGLVRLALRALLGRINESRDYDAFCTVNLDVETHHAQLDVATDGEVVRMVTPLRYRVRPRALKVFVAR